MGNDCEEDSDSERLTLKAMTGKGIINGLRIATPDQHLVGVWILVTSVVDCRSGCR
jgi:hypothetical protein